MTVAYQQLCQFAGKEILLQPLTPVCVCVCVLFWGFFFREVKVTEVKQKDVQLSVERVPGTLSTASKSVQVNGAATVSNKFSSTHL